MPSIVISGNRYRMKPEEADRSGPFRLRFLAEGDSWMSASAWNQGALPESLAREYNKLGRTNLIVNVSTSGHTLTRIVDLIKGDFAWWLKQDRYDGILFSAGGNDFIDAARDTPPGKGLLKDLNGKPTPSDPYECLHLNALKRLVDEYLNPNFEVIYRAVRRSKQNADTPIFLNCYDTPTARDAPAIRGISGPWLFAAYTKNGIAPSVWPDLTEALFSEVRKTVEAWPVGRTGVHAIPTTGLLEAAKEGEPGESGDWINEIHPNKNGWRKQVSAWLRYLPT